MSNPNNVNPIEAYEAICNRIIAQFAEKHDLEFNGWINDEVGGWAWFSGYYCIAFNDIVYDLKQDFPKRFILEWHETDRKMNLKNYYKCHTST